MQVSTNTSHTSTLTTHLEGPALTKLSPTSSLTRDLEALPLTRGNTIHAPEGSPIDRLSRCCPFPSFVRDHVDVDTSSYVELQENDKFFPLVASYTAKKAAQSFTIGDKPGALPSYFREIYGMGSKKEETSTEMKLGLGIHRTEWRGHNLAVLVSDIGAPVGTNYSAARFRSMVVFTNGKGKQAVLQQFLETLLSDDQKMVDNVVKIYRWSMCQQAWAKAGMKAARPMGSVVLPKDTKTLVTNDLDLFLSEGTHKFYHKHGIPYKRSFLFRGPPGAGKTSLIQALAGHYKRNLCIVQAAHPKMTDEVFSSLIQQTPNDSVLVLEDVDALFACNRDAQDAKKGYLTFSGVLNALDGICSPDAQIFVMTTNHPERLDKALIRPGRVDQHVFFHKASGDQISAMFLNFYDGEEALSATFSKGVRESYPDISMAALQQHFIRHMRSTAQECMDGLDGLKDYVVQDEERILNKPPAVSGSEDCPCDEGHCSISSKPSGVRSQCAKPVQMTYGKLALAATVLGFGIYGLGRAGAPR